MKTIELLEIKKSNFLKIKSLAEEQEKLVSEDLMHDYLQLSVKRDRIKNEIDSDQKKYRALFEKADRREREMAMSINREISEIIESIMETDKRIEKLIGEKKRDVLDGIKALKKGRNAVKGYSSSKKQVQPRFIKKLG